MPLPLILGVVGVLAACTGACTGMTEASQILKEAEENGFKNGYRKGCIDTSKKFAESTEEHVAKVCGMYGLGIYMGLMDGSFDKDDADVLLEVLGNRYTLEEYVRAEVNKVVDMQKMDLSVIGEKYLNKVGADGIKDCDCAVKDFVRAYRRKGHDVSDFYNKVWKPYCRARE